jgi:hypothetical protein
MLLRSCTRKWTSNSKVGSASKVFVRAITTKSMATNPMDAADAAGVSTPVAHRYVSFYQYTQLTTAHRVDMQRLMVDQWGAVGVTGRVYVAAGR